MGHLHRGICRLHLRFGYQRSLNRYSRCNSLICSKVESSGRYFVTNHLGWVAFARSRKRKRVGTWFQKGLGLKIFLESVSTPGCTSSMLSTTEWSKTLRIPHPAFILPLVISTWILLSQPDLSVNIRSIGFSKSQISKPSIMDDQVNRLVKKIWSQCFSGCARDHTPLLTS